MAEPRREPRATAIRSQLVLEVVSEIVIDRQFRSNQADVALRSVSDAQPDVVLASRAGRSVYEQVASRRIDMGIANPSSMLTLAVRGQAPFERPLPLRVLTSLPSTDQLILAVTGSAGIATVEELVERRPALRVSLRGDRDHAVHAVTANVLAACCTSYDDLRAWGGEVRYDACMPSDDRRIGAAERGEVDAVFDEAARSWCGRAVAGGMRILSIGEATMAKLEVVGLRRAVLTEEQYPGLAQPVTTIDFSGWPLYVHEDASDDLVRRVCAALVARRGSIAWQGEGPLPLETMCLDGPANPVDVPLHSAAAEYWAEIGYL